MFYTNQLMFHMKATFGFPKWNSPEMEHIFPGQRFRGMTPYRPGANVRRAGQHRRFIEAQGTRMLPGCSRTDQRKLRATMQCVVLESVCFALSLSLSQRPLPSPLSICIGHFVDMCCVGEVARRLKPSPAGQNGKSPRIGSNTRGWRERERGIQRICCAAVIPAAALW